jgi:hypothetical protein
MPIERAERPQAQDDERGDNQQANAQQAEKISSIRNAQVPFA